MGLLTQYPIQENPKFDKERIIQEIKDGLEDFPEWSWLTTPDYEFDFILVRTKTVMEEIINNLNPMSHYQKILPKSYQIALGVFVSQGEWNPQECDIEQLHVESSREMFNKLKEYD